VSEGDVMSTGGLIAGRRGRAGRTVSGRPQSGSTVGTAEMEMGRTAAMDLVTAGGRR
jgi:hypothetical protein